jgi:hypothetical protein
VHVSLRRSQVSVSRQLLNSPRWSPPHCQVRAERMPQDVNPSVIQFGCLCCVVNMVGDDVGGQRYACSITKY